jgi:hypothetical protein
VLQQFNRLWSSPVPTIYREGLIFDIEPARRGSLPLAIRDNFSESVVTAALVAKRWVKKLVEDLAHEFPRHARNDRARARAAKQRANRLAAWVERQTLADSFVARAAISVRQKWGDLITRLGGG